MSELVAMLDSWSEIPPLHELVGAYFGLPKQEATLAEMREMVEGAR